MKDIVVLQKTAIQQAEISRTPSPKEYRGQAQEKGTELCRDFHRHGYCYRGHTCKFVHPSGRNQPSSQPTNSMKPDCRYWLQGYCRKGESQCWGRHEPSMCGTKYKQSVNPTESRSNSETNHQSFVQTLANAVSQSMVRVQQEATIPYRGQHQGDHQHLEQTLTSPSRGQQQIAFQPTEQMMNEQIMLRQQQQQSTMMPITMTPDGQCLFFPVLQGEAGQGQ